jgi:hypothetical protein
MAKKKSAAKKRANAKRKASQSIDNNNGNNNTTTSEEAIAQDEVENLSEESALEKQDASQETQLTPEVSDQQLVIESNNTSVAGMPVATSHTSIAQPVETIASTETAGISEPTALETPVQEPIVDTTSVYTNQFQQNEDSKPVPSELPEIAIAETLVEPQQNSTTDDVIPSEKSASQDVDSLFSGSPDDFIIEAPAQQTAPQGRTDEQEVREEVIHEPARVATQPVEGTKYQTQQQDIQEPVVEPTQESIIPARDNLVTSIPADLFSSAPVTESKSLPQEVSEPLPWESQHQCQPSEQPAQSNSEPLQWEAKELSEDVLFASNTNSLPWKQAAVDANEKKADDMISKLAKLDLDDEFVEDDMVVPAPTMKTEMTDQELVRENAPQTADLFGDDIKDDFTALIQGTPSVHVEAETETLEQIVSHPPHIESDEQLLAKKLSALDLELDDDLLDDDILEDEPLEQLHPRQSIALDRSQLPVTQSVAQASETSYQTQQRSLQDQYTQHQGYDQSIPYQPQVYTHALAPHHHNYAPSAAIQPPQAAHHLDLKKLNENKKKSDAYDFPVDLIPSRHVTKAPRIAAAFPIAQKSQVPMATSASPASPAFAHVSTPGFSSNVPAIQTGGPHAQATQLCPVQVPPQPLKRKQPSFFEELPIAPILAHPRQRSASNLSSTVSSPRLNHVALQASHAPPLGTHAGPPATTSKSANVTPRYGYGAPTSSGATSMQNGASTSVTEPKGYALQGYAPQGYAAQGYAAQGYAPQGAPTSKLYESPQPVANAQVPGGPLLLNNGSGGQQMAYQPPAPQQPSALPSKSPKMSKYAPSLPASVPPSSMGPAPIGLKPSVPYVNFPNQRQPPQITAGVELPNNLQAGIQSAQPLNSIDFNPEPSVSRHPQGNMGQSLAIPSVNTPAGGSLSSPSQNVVSPSAARYAPISHRRQTSSSAVQYDPLLAGKSISTQKAQLPTIPQQSPYGPTVHQQQQPQLQSTSQPHLPQWYPQQVPRQVYGAPTQAGHMPQGHQLPYSQVGPPQIHAVSRVSDQELRSRQFPLFSWGSGTTIAYSIPNVSAYGHSNQIKIVKSDQILEESMLKDFPTKKNVTTLLRFLDSQIFRLEHNRTSIVDDDELLLAQLLKHKFTNAAAPFNLGGVINYNDQSERLKEGSISRHRDQISKRHLVALITGGQKEDALKLVLSHQDYALAMLISGIINKESWLSVVESYLSHEFLGDKDHFLPTLFKILSGGVESVVSSFRTDENKKQWACLNWKEIATSVIANSPPVLPQFLSVFGQFLIDNGMFVPAYILLIIGDLPFTAFQPSNSLKMTLYLEAYGQYLQDKGTVADLSYVALQHAGFLSDYNMMSEAQKYADQAHAFFKSLKKQDSRFVYASKIMNERLSGSSVNDGWFAKPKLDKVWGTLDKGLSKLISGDEIQTETKDNGVFSKFNSDLSRTSSYVSMPNTSAGSDFSQYARNPQPSNPYGPPSSVSEAYSKNFSQPNGPPVRPAEKNIRAFSPTENTRANAQPSVRHSSTSSTHANSGGLSRSTLPNTDISMTGYGHNEGSPRKLRYDPSAGDDSLSRISSINSHTSHEELTFRVNGSQVVHLPSLQSLSSVVASMPPPTGSRRGSSLTGSTSDLTQLQQHTTPTTKPNGSFPLPSGSLKSATVIQSPLTTVTSLPGPAMSYPYAEARFHNEAPPVTLRETQISQAITFTAGESSFSTESTLQNLDSTIENSCGVQPEQSIEDLKTAVPEVERYEEQHALEVSPIAKAQEQVEHQEIPISQPVAHGGDYFSRGASFQTQNTVGSISATPYEVPLPDIANVKRDDVIVDEAAIVPAVEPTQSDESTVKTDIVQPVSVPPDNPYAPPKKIGSPYAPGEVKPAPKKSSRFTPKSYTPSGGNSEAHGTPVVPGDLDLFAVTGLQPSVPTPSALVAAPEEPGSKQISSFSPYEAAQHVTNGDSSNEPPHGAHPYAQVGNMPGDNTPSYSLLTQSQEAKRPSYAPISTPAMESRRPSYTPSGFSSPVQSRKPSVGPGQNFGAYDSKANTMSTSMSIQDNAVTSQESRFSPFVPETASRSSSSYEPPSARKTGYEPPKTHYEVDIPEEEEKYDDIVDDEDDDDDDEDGEVSNTKVERKPSVKKNAHDTDHGNGWFGWLRKESKNEPKVYKANLGEKSKFYYDENLKRWVNADADPEELKKQAPPPPPPVIKKKPSSLSKPRSDSLIEGVPSSMGVPPGSPVTFLPGPSGLSSGASGATPMRKPTAAPSDLDSLLGISGGHSTASTRRKKKGRGYVDVMDTMNMKK